MIEDRFLEKEVPQEPTSRVPEHDVLILKQKLGSKFAEHLESKIHSKQREAAKRKDRVQSVQQMIDAQRVVRMEFLREGQPGSSWLRWRIWGIHLLVIVVTAGELSLLADLVRDWLAPPGDLSILHAVGVLSGGLAILVALVLLAEGFLDGRKNNQHRITWAGGYAACTLLLGMLRGYTVADSSGISIWAFVLFWVFVTSVLPVATAELMRRADESARVYEEIARAGRKILTPLHAMEEPGGIDEKWC
ncbi:hypothetical protein ACFL2T_07265 [Elusimicrobiota bacterium]